MTDAEKIEAFIRKRGVTICPPAYAEGCACEMPPRHVIAVDFGFRQAGDDDRTAERPW